MDFFCYNCLQSSSYVHLSISSAFYTTRYTLALLVPTRWLPGQVQFLFHFPRTPLPKKYFFIFSLYSHILLKKKKFSYYICKYRTFHVFYKYYLFEFNSVEDSSKKIKSAFLSQPSVITSRYSSARKLKSTALSMKTFCILSSTRRKKSIAMKEKTSRNFPQLTNFDLFRNDWKLRFNLFDTH